MKKTWLYPILFFVACLFLWEICVHMLQIPTFLLPSPTQIGSAIFQNREVLIMHTLVTMKEAMLGITISLVLAMILAIAMDLSKTIRVVLYPNLVVTQTVPVMVLAPILSFWFGFGLLPKIIMVVFMCFFPIVISLSQGFSQVDEKQVELLKSFQATKFQIYWKLKIPYAMEGLFSGLRIAATYCIGGAIIGEWISASAGLGYYMLRAKNGYQLDVVFACVVVIVLLSTLLNLIVSRIEKRVFSYKRKVIKK